MDGFVMVRNPKTKSHAFTVSPCRHLEIPAAWSAIGTHYKTKWRNIWIRDMFLPFFYRIPAPMGAGGSNQNKSRIKVL